MPTRYKTMERVEGRIVRVLPSKRFGFLKVDGQSGDFFFHSEDYNGHWGHLSSMSPNQYPKVYCYIVESPKGPRVSNVTPIEDATNQTVNGLGRLTFGNSEEGDED